MKWRGLNVYFFFVAELARSFGFPCKNLGAESLGDFRYGFKKRGHCTLCVKQNVPTFPFPTFPFPSFPLSPLAHQVRTHDAPGAYATLKIIPILGMWHETTSTKEALEYFSEHGTLEEREEAYRILYPSYGGSWAAGLGSLVPFGSAWTRIVGSAFGHAANGVRTMMREDASRCAGC